MALFLSTLQQLLFPAVVIFLFAGSIFAILIGAGMILRDKAMFRFFGSMNRWVSTRKATKTFDAPHNIEVFMHRQPRLLGAVFLALAVVSFVALVAKFDVAVLTAVFARTFPAIAVELAVQGLKWILLFGDILAAAVGATLILYPTVLKKIEARMNTWYSSRSYAGDFDLMHLTPDKWAEAHPRAMGWIMIVLGVFVALNLGVLIFGRP